MDGILTVITLLIMFVISIGTVGSAFWFGLKGGHGSIVDDPDASAAVNAWTARADKLAAANQALAAADTAGDAVEEEDEEAVKARKRAEALARKAARQ
ncbi:MAG: hypothetical protein ACPG7F_02705, partial [Aggregatilineales bacterium]